MNKKTVLNLEGLNIAAQELIRRVDQTKHSTKGLPQPYPAIAVDEQKVAIYRPDDLSKTDDIGQKTSKVDIDLLKNLYQAKKTMLKVKQIAPDVLNVDGGGVYSAC